MKLEIVIVAILILAIAIVGFTVSAWLIMLFGNIILEFMGKQTISFKVAFAISVILALIGSVLARSSKSND